MRGLPVPHLRPGGDLLLPPSRRLQQLAAGGKPVHGTDLRTTKFYRTQLCPFLKGGRPGRCSQGLDCGYAHCDAELRKPPTLERTKWCPLLVQGGACNRESCGYAHGPDELQVAEDSQTLKTAICAFWSKDPALCLNQDKCRFAHGVEELRPRPALSPRGDDDCDLLREASAAVAVSANSRDAPSKLSGLPNHPSARREIPVKASKEPAPVEAPAGRAAVHQDAPLISIAVERAPRSSRRRRKARRSGDTKTTAAPETVTGVQQQLVLALREQQQLQKRMFNPKYQEEHRHTMAAIPDCTGVTSLMMTPAKSLPSNSTNNYNSSSSNNNNHCSSGSSNSFTSLRVSPSSCVGGSASAWASSSASATDSAAADGWVHQGLPIPPDRLTAELQQLHQQQELQRLHRQQQLQLALQEQLVQQLLHHQLLPQKSGVSTLAFLSNPEDLQQQLLLQQQRQQLQQQREQQQQQRLPEDQQQEQQFLKQHAKELAYILLRGHQQEGRENPDSQAQQLQRNQQYENQQRYRQHHQSTYQQQPIQQQQQQKLLEHGHHMEAPLRLRGAPHLPIFVEEESTAAAAMAAAATAAPQTTHAGPHPLYWAHAPWIHTQQQHLQQQAEEQQHKDQRNSQHQKHQQRELLHRWNYLMRKQVPDPDSLKVPKTTLNPAAPPFFPSKIRGSTQPPIVLQTSGRPLPSQLSPSGMPAPIQQQEQQEALLGPSWRYAASRGPPGAVVVNSLAEPGRISNRTPPVVFCPPRDLATTAPLLCLPGPAYFYHHSPLLQLQGGGLALLAANLREASEAAAQ